jgi:hypothetical protein
MTYLYVAPWNVVDGSTNVSEEPAASIFGEDVKPLVLPCRWRKQVTPKPWCLSTGLHWVTFQKNVILLFTAMNTPNPK